VTGDAGFTVHGIPAVPLDLGTPTEQALRELIADGHDETSRRFRRTPIAVVVCGGQHAGNKRPEIACVYSTAHGPLLVAAVATDLKGGNPPAWTHDVETLAVQRRRDPWLGLRHASDVKDYPGLPDLVAGARLLSEPAGPVVLLCSRHGQRSMEAPFDDVLRCIAAGQRRVLA
jgi:hypothetical protein